MKSLRKPKRICIYGSNDEKYNFLVKGGEDIRLDERVEQVFSVMNDIVKKNAFCSKNNIQATTYAVKYRTLIVIRFAIHFLKLGYSYGN